MKPLHYAFVALLTLALIGGIVLWPGDAEAPPPLFDPAPAPPKREDLPLPDAPVTMVPAPPPAPPVQQPRVALPPPELVAQSLRNVSAAAPPKPAPPAPPAGSAEDLQQRRAIANNLRQLASAAHQYMLDKGNTEIGYYDFVGTGTEAYVRPVAPVTGEAYEVLMFDQTSSQISVDTPDGRTVTYNL